MNYLGVELTSIDTCNRCYCESHLVSLKVERTILAYLKAMVQ
jgi:hypothetical protein